MGALGRLHVQKSTHGSKFLKWATLPQLSLIKLVCLFTLGFLVLSGSGYAQAAEPTLVSTTATLSILTGTVKLVPAGGTRAQAAKDGMNLGIGDRVLTGAKATALVTFLDGSTLTVQPKSDVEVKRADVSEGGSRISVKINLGTVWARVVRLIDANSSFSLESNTATATVHDGLIGGQQKPDHSFICWTLAGELFVKDRMGKLLITLTPGEKTKVQNGQASGPQSFAYNQSTLKVTASPNVLPLMLVADNIRVAGFIAPALEVNQVFGSVTGVELDGTRTIEVPAGLPGPFTLIIEGKKNTPFTITLEGLDNGNQAYQKNIAGTIHKGERLITTITQELETNASGDPKTAKVLNGRAEPFQPFQGSLPGIIRISPMEFKRLTEM